MDKRESNQQLQINFENDVKKLTSLLRKQTTKQQQKKVVGFKLNYDNSDYTYSIRTVKIYPLSDFDKDDSFYYDSENKGFDIFMGSEMNEYTVIDNDLSYLSKNFETIIIYNGPEILVYSDVEVETIKNYLLSIGCYSEVKESDMENQTEIEIIKEIKEIKEIKRIDSKQKRFFKLLDRINELEINSKKEFYFKDLEIEFKYESYDTWMCKYLINNSLRVMGAVCLGIKNGQIGFYESDIIQLNNIISFASVKDVDNALIGISELLNRIGFFN